MTKISIIPILLLVKLCRGLHECCPEENTVSTITRNCSTGDSVSLECDGFRFSVKNESALADFNWEFNQNKSLIDKKSDTEVR